MATYDERLDDQGQQLEALASTVRQLAGRFATISQQSLEDKVQQPLADDRRTLATALQNLGSTVMGNAQPYDLYPSLASNWTFTYNSDGTLDSAWRTGDEGAASVIVKWNAGTGQIDKVFIARGGRYSEIDLTYVGGVLKALSRTFAMQAEQSSDEFLSYFALNATPLWAGTFAPAPVADYLCYAFI